VGERIVDLRGERVAGGALNTRVDAGSTAPGTRSPPHRDYTVRVLLRLSKYEESSARHGDRDGGHGKLPMGGH
jgi:hypothetical protein